MPRLEFKADPADVQKLSFMGLSVEEIATLMGCSTSLVYHKYRKDYKAGKKERDEAIEAIRVKQMLNTEWGRKCYEIGRKETQTQNIVDMFRNSLNGQHKEEQDGDLE